MEKTSAMCQSHNNRMQRSGHDQLLGRGRDRLMPVQVCRARVLIGQRAVADTGRWATLMLTLALVRTIGGGTFSNST
jgi:hypothetical protein